MGIMSELRRAKYHDRYYEMAQAKLNSVSLKLRADKVEIGGWIRQTRWDCIEGGREVSLIEFYNSRLYYRGVRQAKDNFEPFTSESNLGSASRCRNLPTLIRAAKIEKYYDKINKDLSLEDAKKLFGRFFYCLRITYKDGDSRKLVFWDFVQNKKETLSEYNEYRGWYYNPLFDKNKVLEYWDGNFRRKYVRECSRCGRRVITAYTSENLELTEVEGQYYCDNCLEERNYGKCDATGEIYFREKLKFSNKKDKKEVLSLLGIKKKKNIFVSTKVLIAKNIVKCDKCYSFYVDKDDSALCRECKLTIINDYSDKRYRFLKATDETDAKLYFGTECEIEVNGDLDKCSKVLNRNLSDMVYLKSDGSISHGFEIVSYAMTYKKWYASLSRFKKYYQEVIDKGGFSESAHTTGLHIHLSRDGFKDKKHLARFAQCFYLDKELSREIACREFNHYASWNDYRASKKDYFEEALTNLYATFDDRYHIVNFRNSKTVEIRMFNGTLRADVIFAYIQFCKLLVDYTRINDVIDRDTMLRYIKTNAKSKVLRNILKMYDFKKKFSLREVKKCA